MNTLTAILALVRMMVSDGADALAVAQALTHLVALWPGKAELVTRWAQEGEHLAQHVEEVADDARKLLHALGYPVGLTGTVDVGSLLSPAPGQAAQPAPVVAPEPAPVAVEPTAASDAPAGDASPEGGD